MARNEYTHHIKNSGFTLMEILVYTGLLSILMMTGVFYTYDLAQFFSKEQVASSDMSQAQLLMIRLARYERRLRAVSSPALGGSLSSFEIVCVDDTTIRCVYDSVQKKLDCSEDAVGIFSIDLMDNFKATHEYQDGVEVLSVNFTIGRGEYVMHLTPLP